VRVVRSALATINSEGCMAGSMVRSHPLLTCQRLCCACANPTLTLPSHTPVAKPHGIRLSTEVPKVVCI
jgi:hypothetical protein